MSDQRGINDLHIRIAQLEESNYVYAEDAKRDHEVIERLRNQLVKERDFRRWVDTWVADPIGSYSVSALDGLFKMARDKITALTDEKRGPNEG